MISFGIKAIGTLKPGSVPTIQDPRAIAASTSTTATVTTTPSPTHPSSAAISLPGVKKVRGAFQKRERKRVVSAVLSSLPEPEFEAENDFELEADPAESCHNAARVEEQPTVNSSCQTEGHFEIQGMGRKTF
ncbi:hypothetical protein V1264_008681 [Littorina saxatilis]|uniref:Uncharacterized protein n=1 Tax=Littorina saxatilis TaxID=31220 RepID=A0AAN9G3W1_9CAEN